MGGRNWGFKGLFGYAMIVKGQQNIKVHFAALESSDFAAVLHEISGIRYSLFTIFPFIADQFGIKAAKFGSQNLKGVEYLTKTSRHCIMDSGLFTLMFGAHAGKRDYQFIEKWYHAIVNFCHENNYPSTLVEVDCQKILGVETAWKFRERMKLDLPNNRQINVFHKEDGQKGLDRLIEFSDYIAVSVPEMRALGQKEHTSKLVHYIKNKKPSIDIHLLGCTENKLLRELNFCTSSDSTSWQQVNRYGVLKFNDGNQTFTNRNSDLSMEKLKARYYGKLSEVISRFHELTEKRFDYYSKYALAGELLKYQYTHYAGNQD